MASKQEIESMGIEIDNYQKCERCEKEITQDEFQKYNGYCEECNKKMTIETIKKEDNSIANNDNMDKQKENSNIKEKIISRLKKKKNEIMQLSDSVKKKIIYFCIALIIIIITSISIFIEISNNIKEKQRIEKYNEDLSVCYELIKNDLDWSSFKQKLNEHTNDSDFSSEAYKNLLKAVDERIEDIKNGKVNKRLPIVLDEIRKEDIDSDIKKEVVKRYYSSNSYNSIIYAEQYILENEYIEAYQLLNEIINTDVNQDVIEIVNNKKNEIKEKVFQQVVNKAQEEMDEKDYSSAKSILEDYKDLGNKKISDMYNKATKEIEKIEAEKKAKEEAERKKEEEAERKRQQAELNAKKDKIIVDTNGKRIYKVCMRSNTFSINGTFKGDGYFGVKLLDDNQEFYKLLVNEIGDYVVNKSVRVTEGEYYYLQIECTRGSWSLSWRGTYGD